MSTTRDDLELEQIKAHIEEMRANVEHMKTTDRIEERRCGWYRVLVVAASPPPRARSARPS